MKKVRKKKDIDFIFASSSINVRENRSPLRDTISRVAAAETYADAMKIFTESGLDDGSGDFMTSLDRQSDDMYSFIREVTDSNSEPIIAYMNARKEVLELKTAVKTQVFAEEKPTPTGEREALLASMAAKGDFSKLEAEALADAAKKALTEASASRDPQTVDLILDRALYEYRRDIAGTSGIEYLSTVCKNDADIKNLCTAFRLKRRKALPENAENFFYDGGAISVPDLMLFVKEPEKAKKALSATEYGTLALELADKKASPSECEKALEEKYYAGLMKVKDDIFGSGKVVAYAILYEKWLCDLRLLLTAKKVGKTI